MLHTRFKVRTAEWEHILLPCWTLWTLPPTWSDASRTVTSVKPLVSRTLVAARPAKPAPITTIRGCRWVRRPLLRGSSVPSEEISQLCMPSKLLFVWVWGQIKAQNLHRRQQTIIILLIWGTEKKNLNFDHHIFHKSVPYTRSALFRAMLGVKRIPFGTSGHCRQVSLESPVNLTWANIPSKITYAINLFLKKLVGWVILGCMLPFLYT